MKIEKKANENTEMIMARSEDVNKTEMDHKILKKDKSNVDEELVKFSSRAYKYGNNCCHNANKTKEGIEENPNNCDSLIDNTKEKDIVYEEDTVEEWKKESENVPFIDKYENLDKLEKEYANNENFLRKVLHLKKKVCRGMRYVKGDGCCFYRAMLFGVFEYFLKKKDEIENFIKLILNLKEEVQQAGYTYSTIDEFCEEFMENLSKMMQNDSTVATIEQIFNDASTSNYLVVFARLLVASHMKLNKDMYLPYITNYASIDTFCSTEVDPMYVEAEHLQINALTSALNFPIEIIYLDNTKQELPSRHRFPEGRSPLLHLLYRPGHYDIVYVE